MQHQHVMHDQEGQRHRGRGLHRQAVRYRQRFACVHHRVLRECPGAAAHHALADLQAGDTRAQRNDLAGAFDARGLGVTALDQPAGNELAAVQRRGMHLQQQLAGAGVRGGPVAQLKHGVRAFHVQGIGLHA